MENVFMYVIRTVVWYQSYSMEEKESTKQRRKLVGQVARASTTSVKLMLLMHVLVFVR